jgi:hypothetical protein
VTGPASTIGSASLLRHDLARVQALAQVRAVRVADLMTALGDRGFAFATLVLAFPFVLPLPTLGMSAPVGAALALAGLGLLLGRRPSLPARVEQHEICGQLLQRVLQRLDGVAATASRVVRPRLAFMLSGPAGALVGLSLATSSLVLALPIPLPLSNFFPALAILLLAGGQLEHDGVLVMLGHAVSAGVVALLWASWGVAWVAAQKLLAFVV